MLHALLATQLLAIAWTDQRKFIVPDSLAASLVVTGLAACWWYGFEPMLLRFAAVLAGFGLFVLIDQVYFRLRGRHGLGMGDAKLIAGSGAWVGLAGLPSVMLFAVASALTYAIAMHAAGYRIKPTRRIPFAPHLALGTFLVWMLGPLQLA